jgi:hypothetical protein
MDEARLLRFGAGKAHLGAAFHAQRLLVETLGFVFWHMPKPRHWVLAQGSHHRFLPASNQNLLFTGRTPEQLHQPQGPTNAQLGRRLIFLVGATGDDLF